jgi:hypothetical protein
MEFSHTALVLSNISMQNTFSGLSALSRPIPSFSLKNWLIESTTSVSLLDETLADAPTS